MGMLLRRPRISRNSEPTVNGKPVKKEPKTRKLNLEPKYPPKVQGTSAQNITRVDDLIRR